MSMLRKAQKTKQLTAQQRPRVTEFGISVLLGSESSPATAAVATQAAENSRALPGFGFPFNPRGRSEVFLKRLQLLAWTYVFSLQ